PSIVDQGKNARDETQALPKEDGVPIAADTNKDEIHEESGVAMAKKRRADNDTAQDPTRGLEENVLESAAAEWSADPIATGHTDESMSEPASEPTDESATDESTSDASVSFVADPFGMNTLEVAEAQDSDEELELETDEAVIEETLSRLQERIVAQGAETEKALTEAHALTEA